MTPHLYKREPCEWLEKSLCLKSPMLLETIRLARVHKSSFQGTHKDNHTPFLVSTLRSPKPRLLIVYPPYILATDLPFMVIYQPGFIVTISSDIPHLPDIKGKRARKLNQSNFLTDKEKRFCPFFTENLPTNCKGPYPHITQLCMPLA